ncbi:MAG: hypothetical protein SPH96_01205, partial [Agathobacter sp.]|nr:hypothetical protein [Agathobacter sp.]
MPVIAHNIASQFTNRQLNITTGKKTKSAEKLSSGYKINRSADDAAGLQISEKMRSQIRGLNQASRNIQDGVSLCQVADGALNETTDILQRMRELSIQSANGTNGESDRQAIQEEIDQLTKEVDRIANTTSFNKDIYPLKGNLSTEESGTEIDSNEDNLAWSFSSKLDISAYTSQITRFEYSFDSIPNRTSLDKEHLLQTIIGLGMNISAGEKIIISTEFKKEHTTGAGVGNLHNIYALNDTTNQKVLLGEHTFYDVNPLWGYDHHLFYNSASGSGF